jgi:HlyD family secretion protein
VIIVLAGGLGAWEAEADGEETIAFPEQLTSRMDNPDVARAVTTENKLFERRKAARLGQKAQLQERIGQLHEEADGIALQAKAKAREIVLIEDELKGVRQLWAKNLVPISRLKALERDAVRLEGERGQLLAGMAQSKGKISEVGLQILQIDQDLRSEVSRELREIQGKTAELVERRIAAEDQLMRVDIRAPQTGIVHQLAVYTVGGVITGSEPLMLIVPESDELTVEVRLPPQNIDQLALGRLATLRFSAFNLRTTPEINGRVTRISADIAQDQKTGRCFTPCASACHRKKSPG